MTAAREKHWRWGLDRPIALLRQEPEELERLGVVFEDDHDELDFIRHAPIRGATGRLFALVRHQRAPRAGTEIVTRAEAARPADDLHEVLTALGLSDDNLVWIHPDAYPQHATPLRGTLPQPPRFQRARYAISRFETWWLLLVLVLSQSLGETAALVTRALGWEPAHFANSVLSLFVAIAAVLVISRLADPGRSHESSSRAR